MESLDQNSGNKRLKGERWKENRSRGWGCFLQESSSERKRKVNYLGEARGVKKRVALFPLSTSLERSDIRREQKKKGWKYGERNERGSRVHIFQQFSISASH